MCVDKFDEDSFIFVQFMTFCLGTLFLGHPVLANKSLEFEKLIATLSS